MNKDERQELLNRLLEKEIEKLKKIVFPYQRKTLLGNSIEICEGDLSKIGESTIGLYEDLPIEGKDKRYYCNHKITISNKVVDRYINYNRSKWRIGKKYFKEQLVRTIQHELCHAFTKDHYQGFCDIDGIDRDASPIFLSCLLFFGFWSGHKCMNGFRKSKIYEEITQLPRTFKALDSYLSNLILNYEDVTRRINETSVVDLNKKKNFTVTSKFEFADKEAGLHNLIQFETHIVSRIESNLKIVSVVNNTYHIGCCIKPEDIEELVEKHKYNQFKCYDYEKFYLIIKKIEENDLLQCMKSVRKISCYN